MSCPSFDQAVSSFQQFLKLQGWPTEIVWARPADFVWQSGVLSVRTTDVIDAKTEYETGRQAGLGVLLDARCTLAGFTCASVRYPKDEDEAQRHMYPSDGLKLTVAVPRIEGRRAALLDSD